MKCDECDGSGKGGRADTACLECNGTGRLCNRCGASCESGADVCADCVVREKKRADRARNYRQMLDAAVIRVNALDAVDGHAARDLMTIQVALSTGLQGLYESDLENSSAVFDALVMLREYMNEALARKIGDSQREQAGGDGEHVPAGLQLG